MITIDSRSALIPDYETCSECWASLCIYPREMQPDEVSAFLHLEPTEQHLQGEDTPTPWGKIVKAPMSSWFLSSKDQVDCRDLRAHLEWLLAILEPAAPDIKVLRERPGLDMRIQCTWISQYGDGGPLIWPEQLQKMADLNLQCFFDFYCERPLFGDPVMGLPCTNTDWSMGCLTPEYMKKRGWTEQEITEAITSGPQVPTMFFGDSEHDALRYMHPETGKSLAVDDVTRELIHLGLDDYIYENGKNKPLKENATNRICIPLPKESIGVYKLVPFLSQKNDKYLLGGEDLYHPEEETWEFTPGSWVYGELKNMDDGFYLTADSEVPLDEIDK